MPSLLCLLWCVRAKAAGVAAEGAGGGFLAMKGDLLSNRSKLEQSAVRHRRVRDGGERSFSFFEWNIFDGFDI